MGKGTLVTYQLPWAKVEAIVRIMHRDGSVTVEARHVLMNDGKPDGCYLGYRYRMCRDSLSEAA